MRQAQEEELKEKHGFVSNTSFGIMHCNTIMTLIIMKIIMAGFVRNIWLARGDLNFIVGGEPVLIQLGGRGVTLH